MILRQARVWFSALSLCRAYLVKIDGAPFPIDGPGSPAPMLGRVLAIHISQTARPFPGTVLQIVQ
jgi:hypothetical protein